MISPKLKIAVLAGTIQAAMLAGNAQAMTQEECARLTGNQFLAEIERGNCHIDITTAAGPDADPMLYAGGGEDGGRTGRGGERGGGNEGGGGNGDGGGDGGKTGGGRTASPSGAPGR